ncbi:MAG: Ig-like domain repeat protein, partial [Methanobrevibacter sp.]|nr:Ig-like domain repeat protein [Methanobrevibacter sp.]
INSSNNPLAGEKLSILINGIKYNRTTDSEGITSIAIRLNPGEYSIGIDYAGNDKYANESAVVNVVVKNTISASNLTKIYKNDSQYYATFLDVNGNPLKDTFVKFNINGVMYNRKTNDEGIAQLNINLYKGEYILTAMNPNTTEEYSNLVVVLPKIVDNHNLIKYYRNESQYIIRILGDDGNPVSGENVTFNINGVFYTRTSNETGHVKLNINLQPGDYIITADYNGFVVSNNVHVLSTLYGQDLTKNYGDSNQFKVRVLDNVGNPLANAEVNFNINGVFYNRTTASNGVASLNINLMAGEYIITSSYNNYAIANIITVV